ncbi:hypothetical protein F8S13_24080 [Chloroflexia bacterium SDU3-3]|nr:hypothetical protein F8S13_24080 [Chloroflexia bacterium SDU3-3]
MEQNTTIADLLLRRLRAAGVDNALEITLAAEGLRALCQRGGVATPRPQRAGALGPAAGAADRRLLGARRPTAFGRHPWA